MGRLKGRRALLFGFAALSAAVVVAGCGSGGGNAKEGNGMTKIRFVADYNPAWVAQVPENVALEKGWYEQAGLDVEYQLPPTNAEPPRLVGTGNQDITMTYTPELLAAASKGLEVKALASFLDGNTEGIVSFDPSVTEPKDLEGKTVAIYDFPTAQISWETFAKHYGIDQSKVNKVSEGNYGVPLIVSGKVDAIDGAAGGELTDSQLQLEKKAKFWVYQPENGIPAWYAYVLAGNTHFIEENPEATRKFVAVTMRAIKWSEENPDEAAAIFEKRNPTSTNPELAREGWKQFIEYAGIRYSPNEPPGYMEPKIWENIDKFLTENGFLTDEVDIGSLLTNNEFVPGTSSAGKKSR